jgi:hypothetical protein
MDTEGTLALVSGEALDCLWVRDRGAGCELDRRTIVGGVYHGGFTGRSELPGDSVPKTFCKI